jgi:hypothetical protein
MRRFLAWVFGIIAAVIGGVAVYYLTQRQEETINAIRETINAIPKFILYLLQQTWFLVTALALGCFVVGFLLAWFLRKVDGSRADNRKIFGAEMVRLANYLEQLKSPMQEIARIRSCFVTAKRLGLWAPDDRVFQLPTATASNAISKYLKRIGTLLMDGNFREAKQDAKKIKSAFEAAYARLPSK